MRRVEVCIEMGCIWEVLGGCGGGRRKNDDRKGEWMVDGPPTPTTNPPILPPNHAPNQPADQPTNQPTNQPLTGLPTRPPYQPHTTLPQFCLELMAHQRGCCHIMRPIPSGPTATLKGVGRKHKDPRNATADSPMKQKSECGRGSLRRGWGEP